MSAALTTAAPPPPPDLDRVGARAFGAGRFAGLMPLPPGRHRAPSDRATSHGAPSHDAPTHDAPSPSKPSAALRDAERRDDARQDDSPAGSQRTVRPGAPERRSALCRLASIKQLAAELRRRPIAAVLVGICRDLGITPHHPLRQEMSEAITAYGGSVEALEQDADQRWCSKRWLEIPFTPPPFSAVKLWPAPWSHPVTAAEAIWPP